MSLLFSKVLQQAEKTFLTINKDSLKSNLQVLKNLIEKLELKDLKIDPRYVSKQAFQRKMKAPCTFISIYESSQFTMSVFILRQSYTMPLHDHPHMMGLLKVVSGSLKIQSYSKLPNNSEISASSESTLVSQEEPIYLDKFSKTSMLDESIYNYHEITASDDEPAAFFDVLSPPYSSTEDSESPRHCHFFKKSIVDNSSELKVIKLEKIDCPDHYYCDTVYYEKPDFMQ